jgi:hypothetical protein
MALTSNASNRTRTQAIQVPCPWMRAALVRVKNHE